MMGHYLIHVDPSVLMGAMGLDGKTFMHDLKLARWTGGVIEVLVMHPTFSPDSDLDDLPEQLTLERTRLFRSRGNSYAAIADALNASGVLPKRGVKWWPSSVRSVIS